jgi:UDP-N-acetylmuramate dehydrogenase
VRPFQTEGEVRENESLAKYTTWRVGGRARYLYIPQNIDCLTRTLQSLKVSMPILWLGLGSNTLIRDGGFDGLVIMTQGALKNIAFYAPDIVEVDVGVSSASMARFCARNNLGQAEFWAGIPGTMGGALRMNAGCFNGETWDNLVSVQTINRQGVIRRRDKKDFNIAYRSVIGLKEDEWFVSARFKLPPGNKANSLETIKKLLARRAETQPTGEYNCGSVFRNPNGDFAARLIETCGLKGHVLGGAEVSPKHANFITNSGNATAENIEALIELVRKNVSEEKGIDLHQEVHVVGQKGETNDS